MSNKTRNLSLGSDLDTFAQADARREGYATMSEYHRALVRERRNRLIAEDVAFLQQAAAQLPEEEPAQEFFDGVSALQREIRSEHKPARR